MVGVVWDRVVESNHRLHCVGSLPHPRPELRLPETVDSRADTTYIGSSCETRYSNMWSCEVFGSTVKSLLVAILLIGSTGCEDGAEESICVPGASVACVCQTGENGAQVCAPSGRAFEPCECLTESTRPPKTPGPDEDELPIESDGEQTRRGLPGEETVPPDLNAGDAIEGPPGGREGASDEELAGTLSRTRTMDQDPHLPRECDADGAVCEMNGGQGRCVRGRCVSTGPGCTHHSDCDDSEPCTVDLCATGRCHTMTAPEACLVELRGAEPEGGLCEEGVCERTQPEFCTVPGDCRKPRNPCRMVSCSDSGACLVDSHPDGILCETSGDAPGRCVLGRCVVDRSLLDRTQRCDELKRRTPKPRRCRGGLSYRLPEKKWERERERIRKRISDEVRYDMLVGLVELSTGGYNIITTNLRTRDDVRGLVDPSFVAFSMASFTASTMWKSRTLHVWLEPYTEGWSIPTKGSRTAQRKGMAASGLGFLGVVQVKAYREWLEKTFRSMAPGRGKGVRDDAAAHQELNLGLDAGDALEAGLCRDELARGDNQRELVRRINAAVEEGRAFFGVPNLAAKGLVAQLTEALDAYRGADERTQDLCFETVGTFQVDVLNAYLRLVRDAANLPRSASKGPDTALVCGSAMGLADTALALGVPKGELEGALGWCSA